MTTPPSDLDLATDLADAADAITLDRFRAQDLRVDRKPDRSAVTDADLAVEDALRVVLAQQRPADVVAGEERGGSAGKGRCWLIDPIDGTINFLRGVPAWATLIALVDDGSPVTGVISAPLLGRRWWAAAGAGAWGSAFGGEPRRLEVSGVSSLGDAYVSTTSLVTWAGEGARDRFLRLVDACAESRAFGDFWHHCLVAEGVIDLAVEPVVNPWDLAAAQVIVEEAGGTFTDLSGRPGFDGGSALSANPSLHGAALQRLAA